MWRLSWKLRDLATLIWQPCWSDDFENCTNRFFVPKNVGILIFRSLLRLLWKLRVLATLFSYTLKNISIRFLVIENLGIATRTMFICQLVLNFCWKHVKMSFLAVFKRKKRKNVFFEQTKKVVKRYCGNTCFEKIRCNLVCWLGLWPFWAVFKRKKAQKCFFRKNKKSSSRYCGNTCFEKIRCNSVYWLGLWPCLQTRQKIHTP